MKTSFTELKLADGTWTEVGTRALSGGFTIIPTGIPEAPTKVLFDLIDETGIIGQDETYARETSEELQGYGL